MIKISGLIFDLDGTLVDSCKDIADALNHTLASLGLPLKSEAEVRPMIGDGMSALLRRASGRSDDDFLARAAGIFRPRYLERCVDATRLYPQAEEVLEHFRGKPIAVVSNKPDAMVEKILRHFAIRGRFQAVVGGDSVREKKPHPEAVLKSVGILRTVPESTLMVGDGPADIQAGRSAGVLTCAVTYGYREAGQLAALAPDFMIGRIEDLKKIVS